MLSSGVAAADVLCASTYPSHNAPKGYLVMSRSINTPVRGLVDAIGEARTHTMISHGSWFSHATMTTPNSSSDAPHLDPTQLGAGQPGASQISPAAAYVFLYNTFNGGLYWVHKQTADGQPNGLAEEQTVADWLWNTMPYRYVAAQCTTQAASTTYYDCNGNLVNLCANATPDARCGTYSVAVSAMTTGNYYRLQQAGSYGTYDLTYDLSQFSNINGTQTGTVPQFGFSLFGATVAGNTHGVICSTLATYAVANALHRDVVPWQYSNATTLAGVSGLSNEVHSVCMNEVDWFEDSLAWLTGDTASNRCWEAACQVVNCVTGNGCTSSTCPASSPSATAYTVSPDFITGWTPGQNWTDYTSYGPWVDTANDSAMTFNSGGSTYACWGG